MMLPAYVLAENNEIDPASALQRHNAADVKPEMETKTDLEGCVKGNSRQTPSALLTAFAHIFHDRDTHFHQVYRPISNTSRDASTSGAIAYILDSHLINCPALPVIALHPRPQE